MLLEALIIYFVDDFIPCNRYSERLCYLKIHAYRHDLPIFLYNEIFIVMLSDGELQNPPVPKDVLANLEKMEIEVLREI